MATKKKSKLRKTLPKDFDAILEQARTSGDYAAVHAVFDVCELEAVGGWSKQTALMHGGCTPELARWLVAKGANVNAVDTYGDTPLHFSAYARFNFHLPPAVLLELGANLHALSKRGLTPLHHAVDGKNLASTKVLLERGAHVEARHQNGLSPLEHGLQRMSNIDLVAMVPVAEAMLAAGAKRTTKTQGFVKAAAETFEFHRAGFAKDSVDATSAASLALCKLFDVEPPPRRSMHDGKSPIIAKQKTWQKQHAELWELLVPSSGACKTMQGEVIRIAGRIGDEVHRNGGSNWDKQYDAMVEAFCEHVASHEALPAEHLAECRALKKKLRSTDGATDRYAELAVAWVAQNPKPIALPAPSYSR